MPRTKQAPALKISEAQIVRACNDFLAAHGWRAVKMEPISKPEWGKGSGERYMADYLYLRYGQAGIDVAGAEHIWVEWKRRGGKASAGQKLWHRDERAHGAFTLIAGEDFEASIEGFIKYYEESGL